MERAATLNEISQVRKYEIPEVSEVIEYITLILLAVAIPFFLQGPQLLVGVVVNFALIIAAINVKGMGKLIPLILLPSVSALAAGVLFAEVTHTILYMIPFIWAGNAALVFNIKNRHVRRNEKYIPSLAFAAGVKVLIIASGALILTALGLVPLKFLIAMGVLQLVTALSGGILVIPANLIYKKISK